MAPKVTPQDLLGQAVVYFPNLAASLVKQADNEDLPSHLCSSGVALQHSETIRALNALSVSLG